MVLNNSVYDCPFCATDIRDSVFLESKNFISIYNIAPVLPGHSLIIPRKHLISFMELKDNELFEMMKLSRKAIKVLEKVFNTDAFNWTIQEKEEAGQTIMHLHLHIIPRFKDDLPNPGDWYPFLNNEKNKNLDSLNRSKLTKAQIKEIVKMLREAADNP